jgi:hypothetical protein
LFSTVSEFFAAKLRRSAKSRAMGLRGITSEKHAAQSSEKMRKTFSLN